MADLQPEAWAFFARPGFGADLAQRDAARDALVSAAIQRKDGRSAARGIVEWCRHEEPNDVMLDLLVSLIVFGDEESRVMTGALASIRAAGKVKLAAWDRIARHLIDVTLNAKNPFTRAQGAYNLPTAAAATRFEAESVARLKELSVDSVTIVRRAAQRALQPRKIVAKQRAPKSAASASVSSRRKKATGDRK